MYSLPSVRSRRPRSKARRNGSSPIELKQFKKPIDVV